jgi:hypothetical protein
MAGSIKPKQILDTLDAMLRVVTPDHPFQPVLAASIDPHAWRAVFVDHCKTLKKACKQAGANNKIQEACDELHEFAATIYGDSYFDHFHASKYPDRDPQEFGPDDDFFANNPHWLEAATEAQACKNWVQEQVRQIEKRWAKICRSLHRDLSSSRYAPILPAALSLSGSQTKPKMVLERLSLPPAGRDYEKRLLQNFRFTEVFLNDTFLPHLQDATKKVFPDSRHRSIRDISRKQLKKAASEILMACHLRSGWKTLLDHTVAATALAALVARARLSQPQNHDKTATSKQILGSLQRLPDGILDKGLRQRWEEHLKDSNQLQAVVSALHIIEQGYAAVGKNTLGKYLRGAKQTSGVTDKADERLRKLGHQLMAVHGSENWIHPPRPLDQATKVRTPRAEYGWLANPLLILLASVRKERR